MSRTHISQGSEFEQTIGYSRAVVDGRWVFVAGTTGFDYATMTISDDIVDQVDQTLANIDDALTRAGSCADDVARVRYLLPNADDFDHYSTTLAQAHAICAQTYVVVSQGMITQEIIDTLNVPDGPDAPTLGGGLTGFIGPNGKWLAEPHRDTEAIVYGDLDLSVIAFAKFFADGAGHYARPDVFRFGVDRTPQTPLTDQRVAEVESLTPTTEEGAEPIGRVLGIRS